MPKHFKRNKLGPSRIGSGPIRTSHTPESVKALLSRSSQSALGRVAEQRQTQSDWRKWLQNKLPAELDAQVSGVVERDETLVIFVGSAVWAARMKFVAVELDAQVRKENPAIRGITVKVMPKR